jgi:hypothetical protein
MACSRPIDGQKAFGHVLAHAYQNHHPQHPDGTSLQAEKAGKP